MPLFCSLSAQTVTNIQVSQRTDGSGFLDIYYNLEGTGNSYYISLEASFNNGVSFTPIASSFLSGNIGAVSPGINKHVVWNGKGSNNNTYSAQSKVKLVANTDIPCGQNLIINHIAGEVAPVTKTTTYGTVTGIPGEPTKCWIIKNLGATQQAAAVNDATEASAGWYWQFNRIQGYQFISSRIPNTTWITLINENSDWVIVNDPCRLELAGSWRIPTYSEWYNVDNFGGWTNWNGPWSSGLKLHAAGYLGGGSGSLFNQGTTGSFWSSTQDSMANSWNLSFYSSNSVMNNYGKGNGRSVRCLRD